MKNYCKPAAAVLTAIVLSSCTDLFDDSSEVALVPSKQASPAAVTKVVQTFNWTVGQCLDQAAQTFRERGLKIGVIEPRQGILRSEWRDITDTMCGIYPSEQAPLACRVRYTVEVSPLTQIASTLVLSYEEVCDGLPGRKLECPDSNAQRLMLSLVQHLKDKAGVL